ncbi:opioid-binding protein/cell adhesion molecule homolog isoform X1 [Anopheles stephensi]|uniref:opioid-binding protein/cell adhesion molecule homolog isoform X1 n=3 Tax=Anopheles stephensi TaxID=30069 RepID=UPI0016588C40|nr:opioid-binding protein/cell adhesion molecule homolog isoform X1 [Anopheles stephensi]XP_035918464.1 opioid-binding protein/cell adhesion molecule homolog isoform X1 [Anopheles stephensi]
MINTSMATFYATTMDKCYKATLVVLIGITSCYALLDVSGIDPKFSAPIANVTVPVGREGVMTCTVHDLYKYKVAWLRVDTQTILTIETLVITKSERIAITHTEQRIWQLRIKDIRESDKGWYMCQINTDPMKSQMGYLNVVVPPDILDYPTSQDMVVLEGTNVTLTCAATGVPEPTVTWKREGEKSVTSVENSGITSHDGAMLHIYQIERHNAGSYHCIASNGVPPTVSKRIIVTVNFQPIIRIPTRQYYAELGGRVILECHSEAQPNSINYWMKGKGEIILQGGTYDSTLEDHVFKVTMKITIRLEKVSDFGVYKCVAKNSLGTTEESVKVYRKTSKTNKQVENQVIQQSNYLGSTTYVKNYTDNKINDILLTASAASSSGASISGDWLAMVLAAVAVRVL